MLIFKLYLVTSLVIILALFMEMLMCLLSLREINKPKKQYWNGTTIIIDDYEMSYTEYFDKIDDWYPAASWR